MKYIALILILLLSNNVHSRNNYYDSAQVYNRYGIAIPMTITQLYDVLYNKFSTQVSPHTPCYEIKNLPPDTKEFFKVTYQRVALLNMPSFFNDTMKVVAFANLGELFPLVGKYGHYKIVDPLHPTYQDQGDWAETYINGTLVYLKIEEDGGGHIAEIMKNNLWIPPKQEKKGFLAVVWEWIKGLLELAFVYMFIGLIWNETSESDSSSSSSSSGGKSTYSSSSYSSSSNKYSEPSHTPKWVRCTDCDRPNNNVFSNSYGNGECHVCHGTGEYIGLRRTLTYMVENVVSPESKPISTCPECHGSRICQTCMGSGQVWE